MIFFVDEAMPQCWLDVGLLTLFECVMGRCAVLTFTVFKTYSRKPILDTSRA